MGDDSAGTRMHRIARHLPIEVDGIRLRTLEVGDAAGYSTGESDPETARWAYTRESDASPEAVAERIRGRYREDARSGHALRLAIADPETDEYQGLMSFFDDRDDSVEVGFVITPDARGRRVAQRALAAADELARRVGYTSLRARTDVGNVAALRTLGRAGYAQTGDAEAPVSAGLDHVRLLPFAKRVRGASELTEVELQSLVERLLRDTGIPGAQATIVHQGVTYTAAAGALSVRTDLAVTSESIFQIGSITKLFTTVLVLQLVDDGLIRLDDAVVAHVPEFRLADQDRTAEVRIIDLLQHRGGFDGDYFTDGGRGSDAPQALIAALDTSEMFFAPGEQFAYSNAGMVVLGRLVELKRHTDYLTAVRERLYAPLGMEHAVTLPEEAILHGAAVGHTRDEAGAAVVMPAWQLPMSAAATGAALTMSTEDLARFGEMLLNDGRTRDGAQILSPELARLMGERAFSLPVASSAGEGFGVGAFTFRYDGASAYGHDGQTIGQVAGLRLAPEADLVVAMATNRENTTAFTEAVIDFALQRFADAAVIADPELPEPTLRIDERLITGFYANHTMTATVTVEAGQGRLRLGSRSIEIGNQPAMRLHRTGDDVYRVTADEHAVDLKFRFTDTDGDGVADFLWFNRMLRRTDPPMP